MRAARRIRLEKSNGTTKVPRSLSIAHVAHLIRDGFQPGLRRLDKRDHLGQFLSDDGLVDKGFAEDDSLVRPLETLFNDGAAPAGDAAGHRPALVIEIAHDHDEALVFFAEQIFDGDLDVVELDKGRSCSGGVGGFDPLGLNVIVAGDEDDGVSLVSPASCNEVIRPHAVGYPFLRA